ncbi:hypothetical protein Tco_0236110 [Tanacetum coccineum]
MAGSSNPTQIPPQQEQNPHPKQQLESPIPFELAPQDGFDIEDIIFNPNNEVTLLHPLHSNSKYFKVVSDFISKCCLREAFTRLPNQYNEYLLEFWYTVKTQKNSKVWFSTPTRGILREVRLTTFRNAIGANYLSHSSDYVALPSLETIRNWFATIGYSREIEAKGTLRKRFLPPRWRLLKGQIIQCLGVEIDFAKLIWEDFLSKLNKKTKEKVFPYPRFLSLLLQHKMEGYENDEVTLNLNQVFSALV